MTKPRSVIPIFPHRASSDINSVKEQIVGENQKLKEILRLLEEIGQKEISEKEPVLIFGETGTGKEITARFAHGCSLRKNNPFVVVDCASVHETLFESTLFGYKGKSFTGSETKDRRGKFECADEGAVFLDEIGELPLKAQKMFLRFLENMEISRVGDSEVKKINVRVICATNKNLSEEVKKGNFRMDLYQRLKVFYFELPPLRERGEKDFYLLITHFLESIKNDFPAKIFSVEALEKMKEYSWPGNIREMRNVIFRAVLKSCSKVIYCSDIDLDEFEISEDNRFKSLLAKLVSMEMKEATNEFRKIYLTEKLKLYGGKRSKTASAMNIEKTYLSHLLVKHNIKERKEKI